jgi:amino acid adenylation domain-containing protein
MDLAGARARAEQERIAAVCRHPAGDFEHIVLTSPEDLPAYFERRAAALGARLALRKGVERLTHRELQALAGGLARRIRGHSDRHSAPVALLLDNGPAAVAAMLAVWKAGKFFVMLDPDAPPERLAAILRDCEAELLVAGPAYRDRARAAVGAGATPILDASEGDPARDTMPGIPPRPGALACLVYTSGTTGRPKGVMVGYACLARRISEVANRSGACRHDREAVVRSLAFVGDLGVTLNVLATGASAHFFDVRVGGLAGLRDFLQREAITILSPGVTLFRQLVGTLRPDDTFPALRLVRLAGEQVRGEDLAAFQRHCTRGSVLRIGYSSTETGPICDYLIEQATPLDGAPPPCGYPVQAVEVLVADADGTPREDGAPGEIVVRSPALALGYWRQPDETAARFLPGPAGGPGSFRTGDRGQWRPDGMLTVLGRVDAQVKVRGNRVEPAEVELALLACPGVQAATVTMRPDRTGRPWLTAYVVGGAPAPSVTVLREALTARLPAFMVPQRFVRLDALPLTLNGKVEVQSLPPPPTARPELAAACVAPRFPMEALVAAAWQEVLGIEPVGVRDAFLDLGGDSLAAMRVVALLQQRLGCELPATTLLTETETVEAVAEVVVAALADAAGLDLDPPQDTAR